MEETESTETSVDLYCEFVQSLHPKTQRWLVLTILQGDQKASVHLMITIQKVTSNVQSILDFKLSPCLIFSVLSFGCFSGVWFILADVSEHSICSIFKADDLEVM
jgi:hypothetical protein